MKFCFNFQYIIVLELPIDIIEPILHIGLIDYISFKFKFIFSQFVFLSFATTVLCVHNLVNINLFVPIVFESALNIFHLFYFD